MHTMHSRLDLNLFRVLDAIYVQGSITAAAENLHLSQPAVSHALARLRGELDDPLFVRRGQKMLPTPYTETIIAQVRKGLTALELSAKSFTPFDPAQSTRRFQVGFRDALEAVVFPRMYQRFGEQIDAISFSSYRVPPERIDQELDRGGLDLVVDIATGVSAEIRHQSIWQEELCVVAREHHPTIDSGKLSLQQYLDARHVLTTLRRQRPELVDFVLQQQNHERRVALRCQHYFSGCSVVAHSEFLLTMPRSYAKSLARLLPISIYPVPFEMPSLDIQMYWHKRAESDPASVWLRETMREVILETVS